MMFLAFGAKCGPRGASLPSTEAKSFSSSSAASASEPMPKPVCLKKWRRVMSRIKSDRSFIAHLRFCDSGFCEPLLKTAAIESPSPSRFLSALPVPVRINIQLQVHPQVDRDVNEGLQRPRAVDRAHI